MDKLIKEYKNTKKELNNLLEKLKLMKDPADVDMHDMKYISEMISNLEYSIEWMSTGKRPGNKRGIERRAAYQREKSVDPLIMQRYIQSEETDYFWDKGEKQDVISSCDRERIEDALSVLTQREKEIFLMSRGQCLSYEKISKHLNVSKSTVQQNIKRANSKIGKRVSEKLVCLV
jgi:RNA polymerase sigma-70 factor (ECF subfamily)